MKIKTMLVTYKKTVVSLIILTIIISILPVAIRYIGIHYLEKAGAETVFIDDIDLNLFTGNFSIEKLSIKNEGFEPLTLTSAVINLSMLRLLTGKLMLEAVNVDGLDMTAENYKTAIAVGFPLVINTAETTKEIVNEAQKEEAQNAKLPSVGIKKLSVINSNIRYRDEKISTYLKINHITLTDCYTWNKSKQSRLEIDALINDAPFKTETVMSLFSDDKFVKSHIVLKKLSIKNFAGYSGDYIKNLDGNISSDLTITALIDKNNEIEIKQSGFLNVLDVSGAPVDSPIDAVIDNAGVVYNGKSYLKLVSGSSLAAFEVEGEVSNKNLHVTLGEKKVALHHEGITWTGKIKNDSGDFKKTELDGAINILNVFVDGSSEKEHVVSFDRLYLDGIKVKGTGLAAAAVFGIDGLAVSMPVSESAETKKIAPVSNKQIVVNEIQLENMNALSIKSIVLDTTGILIEKRAETGILLSTVLTDFTQNINSLLEVEKTSEAPAEPTEKPSEVIAADKTDKKPSAFKISIGSINLTGTNTVALNDTSIKPAFSKTFVIDECSLTDINNQTETHKSQVVFKMSAKPHMVFNIKGDLELFNPKVTLSLKGDLKHLQLSEFSPYISSVLGYNIKTGVLNADIDCSIQSDILNVKNDLMLEKIKLTPNEDNGVKKITKQFIMPLDQALSLLRDSNDNVKLSIPVTGDIKNPDFNYNHIFKKALGKAAKSASISLVKNLLQPYGTFITIGQYALKGQQYMTKIRLDPITFAPGNSELTLRTMDYLDTVVRLLNEKKELRLSVCGFSTIMDVEGVNMKENPDPYIEIAKNRQQNVIQYLESKGISHKRLFHCNPETDSTKKANPRVEMSI